MSPYMVFMLEIMLFQQVLSEDCTTGGDKESSFVKTTDTIIFHFEEHHSLDPIEHLVLERMQIDRREHICRFDVFVHIPGGDLLDVDCSSHYENRTSVVLIDADIHYIMLDVTISKAEKPDNGTYMIWSIFSGISKCFTVFILGQPDTEIEVSPPTIEQGTSGRFKCSSISTTVPNSHNLTIQRTWLVNDKSVESSSGRFQVDEDDLIIHSVTRTDKELVVSCKAVEEKGLTTLTNTTVPVGYGPESLPRLYPPYTFYHLDPEAQLPTITCSSDCNPPCDLMWEKVGTQTTLSLNGTLSLSNTGGNLFGEYACIATRNGTYKTGRISIIVLVKEARDTPPTEVSQTFTPATRLGGVTQMFSQNYTPVSVVGGVLGAALLTVFVIVLVLLRRGSCAAIYKPSTGSKREDTTVAMELQNTSTTYEDLNNRNKASPTYDALNLGIVHDGNAGVSNALPGKDIYENTTMKQ